MPPNANREEYGRKIILHMYPLGTMIKQMWKHHHSTQNKTFQLKIFIRTRATPVIINI